MAWLQFPLRCVPMHGKERIHYNKWLQLFQLKYGKKSSRVRVICRKWLTTWVFAEKQLRFYVRGYSGVRHCSCFSTYVISVFIQECMQRQAQIASHLDPMPMLTRKTFLSELFENLCHAQVSIKAFRNLKAKCYRKALIQAENNNFAIETPSQQAECLSEI